MTLARLMAGVAVIGLMAQPALAQNQDQTKPQQEMTTGGAQELAQADMDFVKKAAGDGMAEVKLGTLAKDKATSDSVKQFGQRMVEDHGKAGDELKSIVQTKGVEVPAELPPEAQKAYDDLQKKTGDEFDAAFMDLMVEDHQKAVDLFKQQAELGTDAELKAFAAKTLPTLEEHLELATMTQEQVSAAKEAGMPKEQAASEPGAKQPAAAAGAGQQAMTEPAGDDAAKSEMSKEEGASAPAATGSAAAPATTSAEKPAAAPEPTPAVAPKTDTTAATPPAEPTPAVAPKTDTAAEKPAAAPEQQAAVTTEEPAAAAAAGAVLAEDVIGSEVVNSKGDQVGKVTNLVIDADKVEYAVVSVGGFLGIGDKEVVIPLDQLKLGEDQVYLITAETEDQLKQMPEYQEDQYQPKG